MYIPQSWSPAPSATSNVPVGKVAPRLQSPPAGIPPAPWAQHLPLAHQSTPAFAVGNEKVHQTPLPSGHPPVGDLTPYVGSAALPPPPSPSHTLRSTHASHRSHTIPQLHPFFSCGQARGGIEFLISSFPFTQNILRVPQGFNSYQDAFRPPQSCMQIQIVPGLSPLIVQNSPSITIEMILRSLHAYLHSEFARPEFETLHLKVQAAMRACAAERWKCGRGNGAGVTYFDALGYRGADVVLVGLRPCNGPSSDYAAVFAVKPRKPSRS